MLSDPSDETLAERDRDRAPGDFCPRRRLPRIGRANRRQEPARAQLRAYRAAIETLFGEHPDHDLFGSLPGASPKLAPRLLGEMGDKRDRFAASQSLQCHAGTAPITIQSGQIRRHRRRHACDLTLRSTVHQWADHSRKTCPWAQTYYQAHRAKGQSHACALRCLGQRWLKILWKMWQTRSPYNEALHTRNQTKHGS